ncbi:hypothetical protein [Peribacillus frigoritolerans]|uniref:hypothetical protein n=1 Tax=Peribacillus frigoritolerans TaxID=450367 RepID=UPI00207A52D3|nr:hypothetical protein [Peribacillus frigoritolerans]USK64844.1 hypothetical protein LIT26_27705 [Peribacillus frigoritolerans]
MAGKSNQILQLCDAWRKIAYGNDGSLRIGRESESFRLLENNIRFHDLDFEEIQAACIGLNRVLLFKGMNTIISSDHAFFWSWIAEVLLNRDTGYFTEKEEDIKKLFLTCTRASLAEIQNPQMEWEEVAKRNDLMEFNTSELVKNRNLILAYLSFPLLEAILKKACHNYVDYSGKVLKDFEIRGRRGKTGRRKRDQSYGPNGNGRKYTISSLGDLLILLYDNVASQDLKDKLTSIRSDIEGIDDSEDPFYVIYGWRNSSLHGQAGYPTIGGTLLNIAIIIALDVIKDNYDEIRQCVWDRVQWDARSYTSTSSRPHWSYYPPYM